MKLSLGEKIRDLREDANLTQSQLADVLNMTQRKISYIEQNQSEPSVEDIREICKFFKITADYLIGLSE